MSRKKKKDRPRVMELPVVYRYFILAGNSQPDFFPVLGRFYEHPDGMLEGWVRTGERGQDIDHVVVEQGSVFESLEKAWDKCLELLDETFRIEYDMKKPVLHMDMLSLMLKAKANDLQDGGAKLYEFQKKRADELYND